MTIDWDPDGLEHSVDGFSKSGIPSPVEGKVVVVFLIHLFTRFSKRTIQTVVGLRHQLPDCPPTRKRDDGVSVPHSFCSDEAGG